MKLSARVQTLFAIWLATYSGLLWAANSLKDDLKDFDYLSLVLAACAGLAAGALRTLISLMQERRALLDIRYEAVKDIVVAFAGGLIAYIIIQGYNSFVVGKWFGLALPAITGDLRIMIIVIVGASRGAWMRTVDKVTTDIVDNARTKIRGGVPPDPASITAPLEGK